MNMHLKVLLISASLVGPVSDAFPASEIRGKEIAADSPALPDLAELKAIRDRLDRSQFDSLALLEELEFDDRRIVQFVQNELAYHHYSGALRGVEGTLQSRAGNLLDQSLLLAALLKNAGFDARIVRGEVPNSKLVLAASTAPKTSAEKTTIFKGNQDAYGVRADAPGVDTRADRMTAAHTWLNTQAAPIAAELSRLNRRHTAGSSTMDPAADVFWVEYRDGASARWQAVYPDFGDVLSAAVVREYFSSEIPPDLQHQVTMEVFIEQVTGNTTEVKSVGGTWKRPTPNLHGSSASATFTFVPDTVLNDAGGLSLIERIDTARWFLLLLDGQPMPGSHVMTRSGDLAPMSEALTMMGDLFITMGERLGSAAEGLDRLTTGDDRAEPLRYIKKVWIEIRVASPDQNDRLFRRTLAAWAGDQQQFNRDLTREVTFTFLTGTTSAAYYANLNIEVAIYVRDLMAALRSPDHAMTHVTAERLRLVNSYEAKRFLAMVDMYQDLLGLTGAYRTGPTIVARYRALEGFDSTTSGFDIISSPRNTLDARESHSSAYVSAGVLGAALEADHFGDLSPVSDSAIARLRKGAGGDAELYLLSRPNDAVLNALRPGVAGQLREELENGYVVLLTRLGNSFNDTAWWRLSPELGEVIAVLDNGWGGIFWAAAPVAEQVALREWLAKLSAVHGPMKVYSASTGCSLLYASIKVGSVLSLGDMAAEAGGEATGEEISPCMGIPYESWRLACTVAVEAAKAAAMAAEHMGVDDLPYPVFMKSCVSVTIGIPTP